ncbi:hypothetical protein [Nonomuraea dietziae]
MTRPASTPRRTRETLVSRHATAPCRTREKAVSSSADGEAVSCRMLEEGA